MAPRRPTPAFNPQRLPESRQTKPVAAGTTPHAGRDPLQLKSDRHDLRYANVLCSCIDQANSPITRNAKPNRSAVATAAVSRSGSRPITPSTITRPLEPSAIRSAVGARFGFVWPTGGASAGSRAQIRRRLISGEVIVLEHRARGAVEQCSDVVEVTRPRVLFDGNPSFRRISRP